MNKDKNKYYLLTFNDDYADEHNVPALACMTEVEFEEWKVAPSGELNPDYESDLKRYEEHENLDKGFWKLLEDKGYIIGGMANIRAIPKDDIETLKILKEFRVRTSYENSPKTPIKVQSSLYASLGNSGENFEEDYTHLYLMEEFIGNSVSVIEVSKDFYETFNKNGLSNLSLCNVFTINE